MSPRMAPPPPREEAAQVSLDEYLSDKPEPYIVIDTDDERLEDCE